MYHHLSLDEQTKELFGIEVPQDDGTVKWYVFNKLQFGYKPAVWVMTRLLGSAMNYFRSLAIKAGVFVDDGGNVHKNPKVAYTEMYFMLTVLQICGWNINWEKAQLVPTQVLTFQGFEIDFVKMEYRLPEWKRSFILKFARNMLEACKEGNYIQARDVSSVLGKLISCNKSHGTVFQVALRHSQQVLGLAVMHKGHDEEPDWDISLKLDDQCIRELDFAIEYLAEHNGNPFPLQSEIEVYSMDGVSYFTDEAEKFKNKNRTVFASDASDRVAFVYEAGEFKLVDEYAFTEEEQRQGSGQRELQSVKKTLESKESYLQENPGRIYWITDSQNVKYFLKKGSRAEHIQKDVLDIKIMENKLKVQIVPIWSPRTALPIVLADLGSKYFKSTDEWSIDRGTFKKVIRNIGLKPTIDCFATRENKMCDRFYSLFPQIGTEAIDFYAQELKKGEVYWVCPPASQVAKAMRHLLSQKTRVMAYISFPEWKSQNYWPIMVQGKEFTESVVAVHYSRPFFKSYNEATTVFKGKTSFRFITVLINTDGLPFPRVAYN
jgi:hypothetical protein